MTTIPRQAIPAATPEAHRSAQALPAGTDRAWQLEMEKAQTQQWFHGAVAPGAATALPARGASADTPQGGLRKDAQERAAAPRSPAAGVELAPRPFASPSPHSYSAILPALQGPSPATAAGASAWQPGAPASRNEATASLRAAPLQPHAQPVPDDRPAVRVHVEESPQGLRVWFGIPGEAAAVAARAQAVLAELRRELPGHRLALVVCNGTPLLQQEAADAPLPSLPVPPHSQEP